MECDIDLSNHANSVRFNDGKSAKIAVRFLNNKNDLHSTNSATVLRYRR